MKLLGILSSIMMLFLGAIVLVFDWIILGEDSEGMKTIKQLTVILLLGTIGQCYANTSDLDTINNWQIYNGTQLVLAGHDIPDGTSFRGVIKRTELKDLAIQFNSDIHFQDSFAIVIDILNEQGIIILTGEFNYRSDIRYAFRKKNFEQIAADIITIRYREKRENGTDRILGQIKLE